eukprot:807541-Rhodomonas_salina.3
MKAPWRWETLLGPEPDQAAPDDPDGITVQSCGGTEITKEGKIRHLQHGNFASDFAVTHIAKQSFWLPTWCISCPSTTLPGCSLLKDTPLLYPP